MTAPDDKDGLDKTIEQTGQTLGETVGNVGDLGAEVAEPVIGDADTAAAEALDTIEAAQSAIGGIVARATGILRSQPAIVLVVGAAIVIGAAAWRRR
ncbi:hypothetical protein KL864_26040 [Mycolicibacterium goodii]|uniref:hypothetical protein n=1 Tax=Mycolicibacterium goodii TaxID=134601 RepID=UPI001BDD6D47|nr:hypothetical protein [Mycolicibacterium goodii]MBU8819356.1 hypothetical protein [Mycolicibacterium goodii]